MFHSYQEKTLENTWDSFNIVGVPSQIDLDVGLGDRRVCLKFHEVLLLQTLFGSGSNSSSGVSRREMKIQRSDIVLM